MVIGKDIESSLTQFIGDIRGLFDAKQQFNVPTPSAAKKPAENVTPSSGGYTAPIHDEWHSSGGFSLTMTRPNGRVGHQGVDMRAPAGTPIYPLADGVVTNVGTDPLGGNVVNIQHANGVRTYYAHLSTVKAQKGDKVTTNTIIGTVGNTGNATHTHPHLHFQVWKDGQIQDPAKFFSVPVYTNLSKEEKQKGMWLSEKAKQEAQAFNMKNHLSSRQANFSSEVNKLLKLSFEYSKIIK